MKKHITRTLSAMLAIVMLMGLLTTGANAAYSDQPLFNDIKTAPQNLYVPWNELYMGVNEPYAENSGIDKANGAVWSCFSAPVTKYLARLSKYMPHVTEAQRTTISHFPYFTLGGGGYNAVTLFAATDKAVLPTLENIILTANQTNQELDAKSFGVYNEQGVITERFHADIVNVRVGSYYSDNVSPRVEKLFSDGRFISMDCGGTEVDSFTSYNSESPVDIFLADSFRNDTLLRNVYLNKVVSYYGENTFRGSAVETVVFPYYWYSDHNVYSDDYAAVRTRANAEYVWDIEMLKANHADGKMPLGVRNNLLFGKNANIIEANAFSDCQNLKSVIMPTEPAHLYIADGVFANCPKLTVYGPAGGTLESYCKANGVKFQAIPEATIEEPLASDIAPMMSAYHAKTWIDNSKGRHIAVRIDNRYVPVANRTVSADNTDNYPNAVGMLPRDVDFYNYSVATYGTDTMTTKIYNAALAALNRYRGAEVNALEVFDTHGDPHWGDYS